MWPAPASDHEARVGDRGRDDLWPGAAGGIEGAGDDEGRSSDLAEAVVERRHRALAGAAQARGEAGRPIAQALRAEARGGRGGQASLAGEHGLAFPLVHERLDPVALEPVGEGVVGGAAGAPLGLGRRGPATDSRGRGGEPTLGWAIASRSATRAPSE